MLVILTSRPLIWICSQKKVLVFLVPILIALYALLHEVPYSLVVMLMLVQYNSFLMFINRHHQALPLAFAKQDTIQLILANGTAV